MSSLCTSRHSFSDRASIAVDRTRVPATKYMVFRGQDTKLAFPRDRRVGTEKQTKTRPDMPFLHWFKQKSASKETEADPVLADRLVTELPDPPKTNAAHLEPVPGPEALPHVSPEADLPPESSFDPELTSSETHAPATTPHLTVAIAAFYAKLPTHLLAPTTADLGRSVQIAEEDVVFDQEAQEGTLPLSILSLSCPEIFIRAVGSADDIPITFSLSHSKELEAPPGEEGGQTEEADARQDSGVDVLIANGARDGENEIKLQLQAILTDFPPQLEPPAIHSMIGTEAEIALPLGMIQSQLAHGRVVIPAEMFCKALPRDLQPYFAGIDPAEEIPIPLQEIFARLPPAAIKLREDQEIDHPEEIIPTPFSEHVDEDAERFGEVEGIATAKDPPVPKDEPPKIPVESSSQKLQAIFLTDEPLDLLKTIGNVAQLPGLKSCLLSTTEGLKLAGSFGDQSQENALSRALPELFQWTSSKLETLRAGTLETITLTYDLQQLSTFVQGKLCLTVLHDNRPFKPGVREKIQAVVSELAALSAPGKPF
jgi:predicted regulator of Ras-like GTPase activity (Roadblock/LC7/MglB family)